MQRRETIHISLGSSSNAVTAHLLNLYGLAGTGPSAPCDANVTHTIVNNPISTDDNSHVWVPRVLIIDEPNQFRYSFPSQHHESMQATNNNYNTNTAAIPTWSGSVEEYSVTSATEESKHFRCWDQLESFHQQASLLAYSSHSRYQAPSSSSKYTRYTNQHDDDRRRHVDWDEMDDEEDEDDDAREYRQRRERQQWHHNTELPLQEALTNFWELSLQDVPQQQQQQEEQQRRLQETDSLPSSRQTLSQLHQQDIPWRMYWMPPYPNQYAVPLPISNWSNTGANSASVAKTWDTFVAGGGGGTTTISWNTWKEEQLQEQLRHVLEDCDSLQGVTVITQGHGIYAGLATELLQELQDDCRTAGRFCIHIADDYDDNYDGLHNYDADNHDNDNKPIMNKENDRPSGGSSPTTSSHFARQQNQQHRQQLRVRNMVQRGLTLHGLASHAHLLLPVTLTTTNQEPQQQQHDLPTATNLFVQSAKLAMALETATLPFRLEASNSNHTSTLYPSTIGLNSYYSGNLTGEFPFGTASSLSFGEFVKCLQPSPQYRLVELDAYSGGSSATLPTPLDQILRAGTSLVRDSRMRQQSGTTSVDLPGTWLQHETTRGGIMSSLSPRPSHSNRSLSLTTTTTTNASSNHNMLDRSLHHHFALAASFRPANAGDDDDTLSSSPLPITHMHVKSLMESMGIRYRPEVSMACVLQQSVDRLTRGGYGAGSYWHTIFHPPQQQQQRQAPLPPVLAVLGNTSRVYPRLYRIARDAKDVLTMLRYRGFYNRDVQDGLLPEREDCDEALNYCMDLRDLYHPPEGSGLGLDEERECDF